MADVLVTGFITIDFIAHVEALPTGSVPVQASEFDVACGGRAANQAMALTAVEVPVSLLARLGEDDHADLLREELVDLGVDVEHLTAAPSQTGLRMVGELPDGATGAIVFRGANDYLSVDDLNRRSALFASAGAVGVTTEPAGSVVLRALELAQQGGTPTVLTHAAGARNISDRVLAACSVLVLSDSTCQGLLDPAIASEQPQAAARALCQRGAPAVALLTRDRALLATPGEVRQVTSPGRLDSEDAVDAFAAGVLHGLSQGEPLEEAVLRGVRVGNLLVD
jgi:ribokinase